MAKNRLEMFLEEIAAIEEKYQLYITTGGSLEDFGHLVVNDMETDEVVHEF